MLNVLHQLFVYNLPFQAIIRSFTLTFILFDFNYFTVVLERKNALHIFHFNI